MPEHPIPKIDDLIIHNEQQKRDRKDDRRQPEAPLPPSKGYEINPPTKKPDNQGGAITWDIGETPPSSTDIDSDANDTNNGTSRKWNM